jgi:hypothetical protein
MTEPGEPLEVASSTLRSAARYRTWAADTGIGAEWVTPQPLCCVPLPVYPAGWPAGRRRWPGLRPAMMWHPLLWLPERLATRYTLLDKTGGRSAEPDDVWALRVCLEVQASGLYDADTGSWLDVLSLAGLDGDDPDTATRVAAWLNGRPDPVLDGLDLTEHVDRPSDPDWAVFAAIAELPALQVISWAVTALDLLEACEELTETGGDTGRVRRAAAAIAALAGTNLRGLPDDGGLSVTGDRDPRADEPPAGRGVNAEDAWWDGMVNRIRLFTGDPRELIDTLVRDMADRLTIILDIYAPDAETLLGADPAP